MKKFFSTLGNEINIWGANGSLELNVKSAPFVGIVEKGDNSTELSKLVNKMYKIQCMRGGTTETQKLEMLKPFADKFFEYFAKPQEAEAETETKFENVVAENIENKFWFQVKRPVIEKVENTNYEEYVEEDKGTVNKLQKFFNEFEYTIQPRFFNTLNLTRLATKKGANDYIINYFKVSNNSYADQVANKLKSAEWQDLIDSHLLTRKPKSEINSRLGIFFGPAGSGKTTLAEKFCEKDNGKGHILTMLSKADMTPTDMLYSQHITTDGGIKATPSVLNYAIQNGYTVVVDECNHLNTEALDLIQQLTDNKTEFWDDFKGEMVAIHPNFKIIFTMNLDIDGVRLGLPQPIVDRASFIVEKVASPQQLLSFCE